jgi:hypothetical protein
MAVGEGCCRMAHRTVRCASHVTQPLGFDCWSFWHVGHRTVRWCAPDRFCSLSGAPFGACSDFYVRSCTDHCRLLQTIVGVVSRCSAGTPDSPVNYSGVAPRIPEASKLELIHPGAPDSPVRQIRAAFGCLLLFLFEPFLGLFIGLCWTCRTYNLEQTS